ncbi:MAG: plastocyanin/azurin family copper-binding protein [Rudaea sp.]
MQLRKTTVYLLWLSLMLAGSCDAANHVVIVGGDSGDYYNQPVLSFNPSQLTIDAGDTVTFKNAGGFHTVHSDSSAVTQFQCSENCSDNNLPSANAWSATVTFPTAGTIGYHCDQHVNMGMHGTITVNAPPPPPPPSIALGGYMSGAWYTPGQSGHGFLIEAAKDHNMVAIWFVFAPDGSAQNWVYAQGNYDTAGNTATLPAVLLTGAAFPPNFDSADLTQTTWGTLTFTFSDCNNGVASWNSTLPGYGSGTLPIARLTQIDGTSCPQTQ